jgi:hypothetical protein
MLSHWKLALAFAFVPAVRSQWPDLATQRTEISSCWGDVNGDKKVDVADAHLIARFAIGMRVVNRDAVIARGDVTGDGNVNVTDAQQIARHSVGLPAARRLVTSCR